MRMLLRLLAAAIATTMLGGCGRHYGPHEVSFLVASPADLATANVDSSLPESVCKAVCGPLGDERDLGCFLATLESSPNPQMPPALAVGTPFIECRRERPAGSDLVGR